MKPNLPAGLALFVREDVRDTRRERQLHLLVGIFVLLALLVSYAAGRSASGTSAEGELVEPLFALFSMLTPLLALAFFASAIVEKRTGGALEVILGLPIDRGAVVVGTFLGRSLLVCAAVFASLLAAVPLALVLGTAVDPGRLVGVGLLLCLLGVTFTAFAVAVSAIARTATRATAGAFGVFVLFFFRLWGQLPRAILYVRHGFSFPETTPEWVDAVAALNPVAAYTTLVADRFPALEGATFVPPPSGSAVYEGPAFALAVLVGWIVVAIGIGSWRFGATDL